MLGGGTPGPHKIEGVGIGYEPPLFDRSVVDEIIPVSTADAKAMARRLAREVIEVDDFETGTLFQTMQDAQWRAGQEPA